MLQAKPGCGLQPAWLAGLRDALPCSTVNRLAGVGWRVDYTLSSSLLRSVEEPMVHLRLEVAPAPGALAQPVVMSLSADKFQVLLAGEVQLHLEGAGALPHLI